eukprot:6193409-Pleurochrysis_carterae.AAC.4
MAWAACGGSDTSAALYTRTQASLRQRRAPAQKQPRAVSSAASHAHSQERCLMEGGSLEAADAVLAKAGRGWREGWHTARSKPQ